MTEEEIYQQIEEYSEESNALYERIHEQVETSIVKHAQTKKKRKKFFVGIMSVAMVLVVTLAIVLPIVLRPQEEEVRYNDLTELTLDNLDCNLKEYYKRNNLSLLFLDWYEYAEDLTTERYYEKGKENDTVYLRETFTDGNTGYLIQLSVVKRNIVVEILDNPFEEPQTTSISGTEVTYILNRNWSLAKFEYNGYKYYLEIRDEVPLEFLVETIESMLNN